jgi:hypothetical protein
MAAHVREVLCTVESLQSGSDVTIIKISEPITSAFAQQQEPADSNNSVRTSDVSNSSLDNPTPASLEADLAHYRELFAKLRFSYVEQVTKEKFIRAIVGDPPLIVSPQENADLEAQNAVAKAELKALKNEVADMVVDLETRARDLSRRYERVQLDTTSLRMLPEKMDRLESDIAKLRGQQEATDGKPGLNLPLAKTALLVQERRTILNELDRQLGQVTSQIPRKRKEMERLQAELGPLEAKRCNSTTAAREAQRRKENALGGVEDDLEERGRWFRACDELLRVAVGIKA